MPAPDRVADLVLAGGRVATLDPVRSWAAAVAVRHGWMTIGHPSDRRPRIRCHATVRGLR